MMFSSSRLRPVSIAAAAVVLLATAPGAYAQSNTGALRGEVKDASGAKVKDATVTLTNLGTKLTRTAKTNDAGIYQFSAIDPGDYKVVVEGSGFKTYAVDTTSVTLAATTTVDATLTVGSAGETVEVTASEPLLDTASASGGQLFNKQMIQDLPNLGRNPFIFEKLDSNVTTTGDPRYVRAEDQTGLSQISVAGAPIGSNNYVVDGIPISRSDGGVTFIPSPEAVSDAKVQANTYDAEVGRTGGGVFNTSLTSGSATYHGALYGETRQTNWSANNWFNRANPTTGLKSPTPDDTTYLYAGGFGGPLFPGIAKKFTWLDKTFFYVTEEGYRQAQLYPSSTATTYVPTAAERNGDFSADYATFATTSLAGNCKTNANYGKYVIFDPRQPLDANGCRTVPFSDGGVINKIPASLISPVGKAILNAYPAANLNSGTYSAQASNFSLLNTFKTRSDMYSGKLEHTFAPWWTSGISYVHLATQEPSGFLLGGIVAENANKLLRYNDATAINNTFTLNPTTLLTVGYGFNRYYSASFQYSNGIDLASLGFPSSYVSQLQSKTFPSITLSNVTNGRGLGGANGTIQEQASKNLVVGITKTINRHNVKVGYVYRMLKFNNGPNSVPSFTFNGQYTASNPSSLAATNSVTFADVLLGAPSAASYTLNSGNFLQVANYHAAYAQDDFRVNAKLTLNVGLRYEYELGQREATNRYNVGFDPNVSTTLPAIAGPVALKGGLLFAGVNGAPIHCCAQSHVKFSPRIGVAYQIDSKTVLHGGFGLFYAPVGLAFAGSGYAQATSYAPAAPTTGTFSGIGSASFLQNPFPTGFVQPSGNSLGALTGVGSGLPLTGTLSDLHRRYPLVQQYSFDIQRDLPLGINVKVSYVGAHSRNIANSANINQLSDATLASYAAGTTSLATNITNPYRTTSINGYAATGILAQSTITTAQSRLPFPQYGAVTVSLDNGYSRYNSLAVKVQKRMTSGLTVLSTYTWSSNWDNLWSAGSQVYSTYGPQDIYNPNAERSRALNNVPNRFTAAFSYDLPFGRGKKFFGNAPWYINELIGGWQINDEWVVQNGIPLTIQQTNLNTTYGSTGVGGSYQRPNLVGDAHQACLSGRPQGRLGIGSVYGAIGQPQYVNAAAFAPAKPYSYGNAPRMLPCQGPGSNNSDVSINKNFKISEKVNAQFRAEALNAFNTPQFGSPTLIYVATGTGAFGTPTVPPVGSGQTLGNVSSQINYSRIIQLGGRISF